jgi:hypothetical protein
MLLPDFFPLTDFKKIYCCDDIYIKNTDFVLTKAEYFGPDRSASPV